MQEYHPIKYFVPAWFAMIMGTGGLGNVIFLWQDTFAPARMLGMSVALVADVLYFVVLVPWVLRWVKYFPYAYRDLNHPLTGNFFVTMPVGTVILGANIYLIWSQYLSEAITYALILVCWILAMLGVTFFTFYTTFRFMREEETPQPEMINFSWIMAPIANMALALIGNPVLEMTLRIRPAWGVSVLVANLWLFGIGFFLFIFISSIVFVRLANHPLPSGATIPSFGIFLSAVGLAAGAIIDAAKHAHRMGLLASTGLSNLIALVIWGFGIWILGIIIMISIYKFRKGGIPFSMAWWAYIFPLAAYTIAGHKISVLFVTPLTTGYTAFLTILLILLWVYTFGSTLRGAVTGKLFMGVPLQDHRP